MNRGIDRFESVLVNHASELSRLVYLGTQIDWMNRSFFTPLRISHLARCEHTDLTWVLSDSGTDFQIWFHTRSDPCIPPPFFFIWKGSKQIKTLDYYLSLEVLSVEKWMYYKAAHCSHLFFQNIPSGKGLAQLNHRPKGGPKYLHSIPRRSSSFRALS